MGKMTLGNPPTETSVSETIDTHASVNDGHTALLSYKQMHRQIVSTHTYVGRHMHSENHRQQIHTTPTSQPPTSKVHKSVCSAEITAPGVIVFPFPAHTPGDGFGALSSSPPVRRPQSGSWEGGMGKSF